MDNKKYLNKNDDPAMGLNNTICTDKKYYCRTHMVYLSEEDVKTKKCMCKPTFDMISFTSCKWLEKVN